MKNIILIYTFVLLVPAAAMAQGSTFSFQGRLNDGTIPANGRYDLQFRLYNSVTGGAQIGAEVSRPNTILINGVFSTTLDFGAAAFNNPSNIFIEIGVRPAGSPNPFTILGPRQQLTVVPFAIRAVNATNATYADEATNAVNAQDSVRATYAVNAVNATNATNAQNSINATTAANAVRLGGVLASGYAQLDVINPGQLVMDGSVRQSVNSNGLVKAMLVVNASQAGPPSILRCYNSVTNESTGNCGFVITQPLVGVVRIDFGFSVSSRFVSVTAQYATSGNSTNNSGANYRLFDNTSVEVFTFASGNSADTIYRNFTIIMF